MRIPADRQPVRIVIDGKMYRQEKDAIRVIDNHERRLLRHIAYAAGAAALSLGILATLFGGTAKAAQATWFADKNWSVTGDTAGKWCIAHAQYKTGHGILISRTSEGWSLGISGTNAILGKVYFVPMAGKLGSGTISGVGMGDGLVKFPDITPQTVLNLALTPRLAVEGIATFEMKGSANAIQETIKCFKAMNGQDV